MTHPGAQERAARKDNEDYLRKTASMEGRIEMGREERIVTRYTQECVICEDSTEYFAIDGVRWIHSLSDQQVKDIRRLVDKLVIESYDAIAQAVQAERERIDRLVSLAHDAVTAQMDIARPPQAVVDRVHASIWRIHDALRARPTEPAGEKG